MPDDFRTHIAALSELQQTLAEVRVRIEALDTFDRLSESIEAFIWSAHDHMRRSEQASLPIGSAAALFESAVAALDEATATIERLRQQLETPEASLLQRSDERPPAVVASAA